VEEAHAAAIMVQAIWKGYITRKHLREEVEKWMAQKKADEERLKKAEKARKAQEKAKKKAERQGKQNSGHSTSDGAGMHS